MFSRVYNIVRFVGVVWILRTAAGEYAAVCNNENCAANNSTEENETGSRVLSRSKRFLVFPDGSSLQLVFCVQTSALIPIGDIFLYGNTAALAWNLPSDPNFLQMLKEYEKTGLRRNDNTKVNYMDEYGKIIASVPFRRPNIVNPAFAKRSVDDKVNKGKLDKVTYKEKLQLKMNRSKMHEDHLLRDFLKKGDLDNGSVDFHRRSRVELYSKLESLIRALGGDGRQCVLYKLCESALAGTRQGTFLQELLRVVFTLPKGKEFASEDHKEYDAAHVQTENCSQRYPGCGNFQITDNL